MSPTYHDYDYDKAEIKWHQSLDAAFNGTLTGQETSVISLTETDIIRLKNGEFILLEINGNEFHVIVTWGEIKEP